jgi:SAM-dependent methyltransferase
VPLPPEPPPDHPDRIRWNLRYREATPAFIPHPLAFEALAAGFPPGPVLELACGPSGSALELAQAGRTVHAADISEVGLEQLRAEAERRGLSGRILPVLADLAAELPEGPFCLVLCTRWWAPPTFAAACARVAPGGLLAWEAFTLAHVHRRPGFRAEWCLKEGEPGSLLPPGFELLSQRELDDGRGSARRMIARRG